MKREMRTVFSTANVPRGEAFDYWMDVVCANFGRRKIEVLDRPNFSAEINIGTLDDLVLANWRTVPRITRCDGVDDLQLALPSRRFLFEIADRSFELNQSNLCLFDTREPYAATALEGPVERVMVRIPRDAIARRISIADVVNRPILAQGVAGLLTAFVRELVRVGPSSLSPTDAALVREQLLDLIAVTTGNLTGVTPRLGAASRFGTLKLRAAIDSQLTNPNADPQSIAAAAAVSERHANRLLAMEGTSIRRLLLERRLAKCRAAFEDPLQRRHSISEIVTGCGFRHLSHFTRAFKRRYGLTPHEYRNTFDPAGH